MQIALNQNQMRTNASPGATGTCPHCAEPVTAKCGTVNVWHWAHRARSTCPARRHGMTEWHRAWGERFPLDWREISHRDPRGQLHIADVQTPHGITLEIQHSAISEAEIRSREAAHTRLVWIIHSRRPVPWGISPGPVGDLIALFPIPPIWRHRPAAVAMEYPDNRLLIIAGTTAKPWNLGRSAWLTTVADFAHAVRQDPPALAYV